MENTKTVEVRVRFWTNAGKTDRLPKGYCWDTGAAVLIANPGIGTKSSRTIVFNDWDRLQSAVAQALSAGGIRLVRSARK